MSLKGLYFCITATIITLVLSLGILLVTIFRPLLGHHKTSLVCHKIASLWGFLIIVVMPGWSVEVNGRENLKDINGGYLIVANHLSMTDIFALFYLGVQFRFISKASVLKIPIIGFAMKCSGYVGLDRGNKESHQKALKQCAEVIRSGVAMLFFPEGTRSKDGVLKPFKIGAFKLSKDEKVPVLPISIQGTKTMLPKGSLKPGIAHVKINILKPMWGKENEDLEDYAARVRQSIADDLKRFSSDQNSSTFRIKEPASI